MIEHDKYTRDIRQRAARTAACWRAQDIAHLAFIKERVRMQPTDKLWRDYLRARLKNMRETRQRSQQWLRLP